MFYPMRDSIQHRDLVKGVLFVNPSEGWTISTAQLKQDALAAIQVVDRSGASFTKWGRLVDIDYLLEPHRFSRKASRQLITFINTYLDLLDLDSLIISHRDVKKKVDEVRSKSSSETPFIAKTYLRRDSHLPILFPPR